MELTPDLDPSSLTNFTTDGCVRISLKTSPDLPIASKKIALHAKQIIIEEPSVEVLLKIPGSDEWSWNWTSLSISAHEYDKDREFYVIHVEEDLKACPAYTRVALKILQVFVISFKAILNFW